MSVKDKLDYLQDTKQAIKTAIQSKGQSVSDTDTFRSYADKINAITTGGGGDGVAEVYKNIVERTITEINDVGGNISQIGSYAFYSYTQLSSVNLPGIRGLYSRGIFQNCYSLSYVNLPNCSTISEYVFQSCSRLQSISLPNCLNIGSSAFTSCVSLPNINLPACTSLDYNVFDGCRALVSASLPNVGYIRDSAFRGCTSLQGLDLPNASYIGDGAFMSAGAGGTLNMPKLNPQNETSIAGNLCRYAGFETINMPIAIKAGSFAFADCTKLKNVNMPMLQSTSSNAFANCTALESISLPKLSMINYGMFQGCTALKSVDIPNCSTIESSAFYACNALESVSFSQCISVNGQGFAFCSSLKNVSLPRCATLSSSAFYGCVGLEIIDMPDLVVTYANTFTNCTSLKTVNLPHLSSVGYYGFSGCVALESIYLRGAKTIYSYAFTNCTSLKTISLPRCTGLITSCFRSCRSLSAIYLQERVYMSGNAFISTPMSLSSYLGYFGSIYVLEKDLSWFQTATNWAVYTSRMTTFTPTEEILQENGGDIASGTSLTMTLDDCEVGDNLIAGVITRSTSPVPEGWNLLEGTQISADGTIQNMNIYTKVATSITESITVTQATAGRMYANIVNIKNKTPSVINEFTNTYNTNTQKELTLTKSTENEILVFAETALALTSGAFSVSGDYDDYYAYGDRGRLLMAQSTEEVGSQIIITHNSTGDVQWATIGIELT